MESNNQLYQIVYDYYATRILFGYYKLGESLPTISKISESFQLSVPTVRTALALLEKDRYIITKAPKAAKVIYKVSQDDYFQYASEYLLARKDGLADIGRVNLWLFGPLLDAGIRQWNENDWNMCWQEIKNYDYDEMSLAMRIYMTALSSLKNDLILNFFWEVNRYTRFPYLCSEREILKEIGRDDVMDKLIEKIDTLSKTQIAEYLTHELGLVYKNENDYLLEKIQTIKPDASLERVMQIPFEWKFYHKRSQIRYSIGAQIILEILNGRYPVGSYLPSLPKMAKLYQVSVITIRRTLIFLADFGVVRSYQGKGTQVCLGQGEVDLSHDNVHIALKYFLESLQFLALTIRSVCRFTFGEISDEAFHELMQTLNRIHEQEMDYKILDIFLTFIIEHCPSAIISHCYHKLAKCLTVGYPFYLQQWKAEDYKQMFIDMILRVTKSLECRDIEGLIEQWGTFLEEQVQYSRTFVEQTKG